MKTAAKPRGSYGVDAPWVPWLWTVIAVLYVVLAVAGPLYWHTIWWVAIIVGVLAVCFIAGAALYWHATFRGKFQVWDQTLNSLPPQQNRKVLDLGCGHGAVAIQTALRNPDCTVEGIDLWRSVDQSGNSAAAAQRNAAANGVADRITFTTGDMADLPYPDDAFDLVTASMSIHNIADAQGRARAVGEAWRVLAPGGMLVIVDIQRTAAYAKTLRTCGATVDGPSNAGWRMWWSGPWISARILRATKAPATA